MPTVSAPRVLRRVRSQAFALEAALLRASVDALSADRHVCRHCHRTPLVGERVHFFEVRHGTHAVCDLCRPLRVSEPDSSELVRPSAQGSVTPLGARP